jgi:hypothetical protein
VGSLHVCVAFVGMLRLRLGDVVRVACPSENESCLSNPENTQALLLCVRGFGAERATDWIGHRLPKRFHLGAEWNRCEESSGRVRPSWLRSSP